jgi:hypothetical protein
MNHKSTLKLLYDITIAFTANCATGKEWNSWQRSLGMHNFKCYTITIEHFAQLKLSYESNLASSLKKPHINPKTEIRTEMPAACKIKRIFLLNGACVTSATALIYAFKIIRNAQTNSVQAVICREKILPSKRILSQ